MANIEKSIKGHNQKVLRGRPTPNINMCNCCRNDDCLLNSQCLTENVVYRAVVKVEGLSMMTYIGLIKGVFIRRYKKHVTSFRLRKYCNSTPQSKYVWKIKDKMSSHPNITWGIGRKSRSYTEWM